METEKSQEINKRIDEIKPILIRLEWDKAHNQLNPGKVPYLESLKNEYKELINQLDELKIGDLEGENATLSKDN